LISPPTTSSLIPAPGFVVPIPILKFSSPTNQYLLALASVLTPTAN
jgi:hypothetical protein